VFAQTEYTTEGFLANLAKQIIPRGYYLLAEGFGIPPVGALFIFFLVWFLASGLIWMSAQQIFEKSLITSTITENRGFVLFVVSAGGIVAYGIGLWAETFIITLSIISLLIIGFIALIIFRGFRGIAAGFGKLEMELRKEMSEVKKDFLKVDRDLKQIEADYKLFSSLLSRETGLMGGRLKTLLDKISNLAGVARHVIYTGDPSQINRALAEVKILKKELEYIKGVLPQDSKILRFIEKLENDLNSIENDLKKAAKDELRMIRELEESVRNQIDQFRNELSQLDQKITKIDQDIKESIAEIKEELQDCVRKGDFEKSKKNIISILSNLGERLSDLDRQIQKLESDIKVNEEEFIRLEAAIMKLGDEGKHIAQELEKLKQGYESLKQEFKKEQGLLRSRINQLMDGIRRVSRMSKINREHIQSIIQTLQELEGYIDNLTTKHTELKKQLNNLYNIFRLHLGYPPH